VVLPVDPEGKERENQFERVDEHDDLISMNQVEINVMIP
jgi:hypothetical protein